MKNNELALTLSERIGKEADDEAQDWSVFGDNKI